MIINLNSKITDVRTAKPLSPHLEIFLKNYTIQRQIKINSKIINSWHALDLIEDRLYLGGELAACNREIIQKNEITHIINAAIDSRLYDHQGIKIVRCQIDDGTIAPDGYFESMANLIASMLKDTNDI